MGNCLSVEEMNWLCRTSHPKSFGIGLHISLQTNGNCRSVEESESLAGQTGLLALAHLYRGLVVLLGRTFTNNCHYSLDASKRPPIGGHHVGAILFVYHHLNFRFICLLFQIYILYIVPTEYLLSIGYPMDIILCPLVLKWVGIEGFYGYEFV